MTPLEKYGPVVQWQRHLVHTQETMVRFHPGPLWLGRQLADHLGLEPGMLWVRLPPEPLRMITNDQCPRGAAWSARLLVTQEIAGSNPVEDACGAVRKREKRRSSNLRVCGFDLGTAALVVVTVPLIGLCSSWRPVKPSYKRSEVGDERFDSFTTHCGPLVYRFRTPASQAGRAGSIPARVTHGQVV